MYETKEIAKVVQNVAKLGEESKETSEKLGGFFAKVFKEPLKEVSGMLTDKLRFVRWRRLGQMSDDVNKILKDRGINETRAVTTASKPQVTLEMMKGIAKVFDATAF